MDYLKGRPELLTRLELMGPQGQLDERKSKKLSEVAGFCAIILRYVRAFLPGRDTLRVLECSCGKSYLGLVLATLLEDLQQTHTQLIGVDLRSDLIDRCRRLADGLDLRDAEFVVGRTLHYEGSGRYDLVVALHACDTATDEAIAKGAQLGAHLLLAVPCCQNQIRGQIKAGHPLTGITEFGPLRYRLANMLTDVLRAQFLKSLGYHVEMDEIASPRVTPKNLCICARKLKRRPSRPRDGDYKMLKEFFGVRPKVERYFRSLNSGQT